MKRSGLIAAWRGGIDIEQCDHLGADFGFDVPNHQIGCFHNVKQSSASSALVFLQGTRLTAIAAFQVIQDGCAVESAKGVFHGDSQQHAIAGIAEGSEFAGAQIDWNGAGQVVV